VFLQRLYFLKIPLYGVQLGQKGGLFFRQMLGQLRDIDRQLLTHRITRHERVQIGRVMADHGADVDEVRGYPKDCVRVINMREE
jgi:hypothetical protein